MIRAIDFFSDDLWTFHQDCLAAMARTAPMTLFLTLVFAIALAAIFWWFCTNYHKLWNKRFQVGLLHHAICGAAAMVTLVAALGFVSLRHTRQVLAKNIEMIYPADFELQREAYRQVKSRGLENFANDPGPDAERYKGKGYNLPVTSIETLRVATKAYYDAGMNKFNLIFPFLARFFQRPVPPPALLNSKRHWFPPENQSWAATRHAGAADEVRDFTRAALLRQTPAVIFKIRIYFVAVFLLVQSIPFAIIGWAAYRDLKEQT